MILVGLKMLISPSKPRILTPTAERIPVSLHPGQFEVVKHRARFKVICAGRRWGKSRCSMAEIIDKAQYPKQKVWYVAPSYRMAKQIIWYDLIDMIPRNWMKKPPNETLLQIHLVNNTLIELKGVDNPDSLRGVGLNYIIMDEVQDMKAEVWTQILRPTLATTGGHAMMIGTPKGYNHFYKLWLLGQNPQNQRSGRWMSWQFPTLSSPFVPLHEIEQARQDMDERSFNQEFNASFENVSGKVYYPFDPNVHIVSCEFNPDLPIWVGQDFNIKPMCAVIMQPQLNGELWVIDEIVKNDSNVEEICDEIERRYWRYARNIVIYPDPAGGNRQHARGESSLTVFRERGFKKIKYRKKHPFVQDRVNSVNRLLRSADGTVRLRVTPKARFLIESLEQTLYKDDGSFEIDKSLDVYHPTDALGYPLEFEFSAKGKAEVVGASF